MSQAAQARDSWADTPSRRPRREPVSWASAEELEVLGGLGEERVADWTVLTLERDDDPGERNLAATEDVVRLDDDAPRAPRRTFRRVREAAGLGASDDGILLTDSGAATERMTVPPPVERPDRASAPRRHTRDRVSAPPRVDADDEHRSTTSDGRSFDEHAADIFGSVEAARAARPHHARRTVVIRGQAAAATATVGADRRRPAARPRDRVGHRPDRVAMWAVMLGLLLIVVATMTAG